MKKKDSKSTTPKPKKREQILQDKIKELHDKNIRLLAEMENLRKQKSEEMSNAYKYAKAPLALDIVEVLDQFSMALSEIEKLGKMTEQKSELHTQIQNLHQGMKYMEQGIYNALEGHGVKQISPLGKAFDPLEHEAVKTITSDEHEHNTVSQVLQCGFRIEDRVLRPAKVTVVKKT